MRERLFQAGEGGDHAVDPGELEDAPGRRTRYTVNHDSLFRHSAQEGLRVGPFLALLSAADGQTPDGPAT
jgi:hypothetical protein